MAAKVTYDTVNKLIICKAGVTELDAKVDFYSDTKEDWRTDSSLSKFKFIIDSIGGDDTSPGETAPLYSYLKYGWRIRPDEADHTLNITNGAILVAEDTTEDPFVDTVGDYTVRIRMYVPVKATIVTSGSGVTEQDKVDIADAVHSEVIEGALTFKEMVRIFLAVLANKSSGGGTTTITFRDEADTKDRIVGTVDESGNRSAVTLDGS